MRLYLKLIFKNVNLEKHLVLKYKILSPKHFYWYKFLLYAPNKILIKLLSLYKQLFSNKFLNE